MDIGRRIETTFVPHDVSNHSWPCPDCHKTRENVKQLLRDVLAEVKPERWPDTPKAAGYNHAIDEMEANQRKLGL
jgi:hypothetical protein